MTIHETSCTWDSGMAFDAIVDGHTIRLDTKAAGGGTDSGPSPKPLLLVALAGCTAMDMISLLQKMRVDFKNLRVKSQGDLTEEHPRIYSKIKLIYEVIGGNPEKEKVEKAVALSQEKYCGVAAMLGKGSEISWEIKYLAE